MAAGARRPVAVVFDIDGTLCDSFALGFGATNTVLARHGYAEIDAAAYHAGCVYTTPSRLARHAVGGEDAAIGERLGADFDETYIALVDASTAGFYPGIAPILARIAAADGAGLAALTNAAVLYGEAVLEANGVREAFGSVHGADSVPKPKPHADGLLRVAADLGVPPERCVYVGDAPSDGAAAVAAGYGGVVGVSYGSHAESVLVDTGHFDVICPTVGALEAALFPKGAGDDAEALAGALRARAPA